MPEAFDVVIVGAGAAGCVLARRLAETGQRKVLLLEAGPHLGSNVPAALRDGWMLPLGADWQYDWGLEAGPQGVGPATPLRRGRLVGGTSWLTRFAVRGAAADLDSWAAHGIDGWAYGDLLPTFRRIETDREFGDSPWHGDDGPISITRYPAEPRSEIHLTTIEALTGAGFATVEDHNEPDAAGVGPMPMSTVAGERITTLDAYLPDPSAWPNLTRRPDAEVARVRLSNGVADGIQLADGTFVDAGTVVVAAGVYGSPVLLLRSGIGPAAHLREVGVAVAVDLPGVGPISPIIRGRISIQAGAARRAPRRRCIRSRPGAASTPQLTIRRT